MRTVAIVLALFAGCAGELPEISEHVFSDVELREFGQEETNKVVVVRNPAPFRRTFHLRCFNTSEGDLRIKPFYEFDVVVEAWSETRFLAEYPVKYKHVALCSVAGRDP